MSKPTPSEVASARRYAAWESRRAAREADLLEQGADPIDAFVRSYEVEPVAAPAPWAAAPCDCGAGTRGHACPPHAAALRSAQ